MYYNNLFTHTFVFTLMNHMYRNSGESLKKKKIISVTVTSELRIIFSQYVLFNTMKFFKCVLDRHSA